METKNNVANFAGSRGGNGRAWSNEEFEDLHMVARASKTFAELNAGMIAKGYPERTVAAYHMQLRTLVHVWRDMHFSLFESIKEACGTHRLAHKAAKRKKKELAREKLATKLERSIEKKLRAEQRAEIQSQKQMKLPLTSPTTAPAQPVKAKPAQQPRRTSERVSVADWLPISAAAKLCGYSGSNIDLIKKFGFVRTKTVSNATLFSAPGLRAYIAARNLVPGNPQRTAPNPALYDALKVSGKEWVASEEMANVLGYNSVNYDRLPAMRRRAGKGHWEFQTKTLLHEAEKAGVELVRKWEADGYVFGGRMSNQPRMSEAEHVPPQWYVKPAGGKTVAGVRKTGAVRKAGKPGGTRKSAPAPIAPVAVTPRGKLRFDAATRTIVEVPTAPKKSIAPKPVAKPVRKSPKQTSASSATSSTASTRDWIMMSLKDGLVTQSEATAMLAKLR